MSPLFRNPLFSLVGRIWWLSVVIPAVAWGLGGPGGLRLALEVLAAFCGVLLGMIGAALGHDAVLVRRERAHRRAAGHRFLCPQCLQFGDFRFACRACAKEVEAFLVRTGGAYVNDCGVCRAPVFPRGGAEGRGVRAYCDNCVGGFEVEPHQRRRVRVLAAPLPADFELFSRADGARRGRALDGTSFVVFDDGDCLSYVLACDPAAGPEETAAPAHAFRDVAAVWLDTSGVEPLPLARAVDALIRQSQLPEPEWRRMQVCVRQMLIDPLIRSRLEAQFENIRYGVEPEEFLALDELVRGSQLAEPSATDLVREVAGLAPEREERPR